MRAGKQKVHVYRLEPGSAEAFQAVSAENLALVQSESLDLLPEWTKQEQIEVRKNLGLSQSDLAKITGYLVSRETFTRIELGEVRPKIRTTGLIRMALAYRLPRYSWQAKLGRYGRKNKLVYKGEKHG